MDGAVFHTKEIPSGFIRFQEVRLDQVLFRQIIIKFLVDDSYHLIIIHGSDNVLKEITRRRHRLRENAVLHTQTIHKHHPLRYGLEDIAIQIFVIHHLLISDKVSIVSVTLDIKSEYLTDGSLIAAEGRSVHKLILRSPLPPFLLYSFEGYIL